MTPTATECTPEQFNFGRAKGTKVIANFQGGTLTSDGGLVLIAELDKKRHITSRFAACFTDHRQPNRTDHSLHSLVSQRVYGLIQGYEDVNDHETLRGRPSFPASFGENL